MNAALTIQRLTLQHEQHTLLSDLQGTIPEGEITLILGPNGAGKTLLLRCLAGLLKPQQGGVFTSQGKLVHELSRIESARLLSWTPVSHNLPFDFSVLDLLLMGRYPLHQGYPQKADRFFIQKAMQRVGISAMQDRIYNSLSRGEQTKVDIARAIAADTPLLIFDEPFANLDIDASLQLMDIFRELQREGRTLVLSHHDLYSVRDLATSIILMKKGQLVASGPTARVFTADAIERTYDVIAREVTDPQTGDRFVRFRLKDEAKLAVFTEIHRSQRRLLHGVDEHRA
jgi:ABC-type cobalamin/Fe3+-siderophores transport system ATPase subunit